MSWMYLSRRNAIRKCFEIRHPTGERQNWARNSGNVSSTTFPIFCLVMMILSYTFHSHSSTKCLVTWHCLFYCIYANNKERKVNKNMTTYVIFEKESQQSTFKIMHLEFKHVSKKYPQKVKECTFYTSIVFYNW